MPIYEERIVETKVPVLEKVERIIEKVPVHHNFERTMEGLGQSLEKMRYDTVVQSKSPYMTKTPHSSSYTNMVADRYATRPEARFNTIPNNQQQVTLPPKN